MRILAFGLLKAFIPVEDEVIGVALFSGDESVTDGTICQT